MFCPNCGKQLTGNYKFCIHCGASLSDINDNPIAAPGPSSTILPKSEVEQAKDIPTCPFCGSSDIDFEDKFGIYCKNCNRLIMPKSVIAKESPVNDEPINDPEPSSTHVEFVSNKVSNKKTGSCLTPIIVIIAIIALFSVLTNDRSSQKDDQEVEQVATSIEEETQDEQAEEGTHPPVSESISEEEPPTDEDSDESIQSASFSEAIGDEDFAYRIMNLLMDDLGISNPVFVKRNEFEDNYVFTYNSTEFWVTAFTDEEGDYIRVFIPNGKVLYEDDVVKNTFDQARAKMRSNSSSSAQSSGDDLNTNNISTYQVMAENAVEQVLKNPKSARFSSIHPGVPAISKKNGIVAVQGYVTSENSFGAMVKEVYTVEFRPTDEATYSYDLLYLNVGNTTIGSYIDLN